MDTISLAIPYRKPAALPSLPALESLLNNNESVTVASPPENSVAGSTYPLSTTDNFSNRALPPPYFSRQHFSIIYVEWSRMDQIVTYEVSMDGLDHFENSLKSRFDLKNISHTRFCIVKIFFISNI